uniref:Remorin C-terminal domain-containing protein n=2 Tax=Kalanchoe fedtschenkoi TaxID=63787 RepID=A0A7N0UXH6_KALFE
MPEVASFPVSSREVSLGSTPPDASPDSLIYAFDSSNVSLFSSSASASADRSSSSFASDFRDREPPLYQNAAGRGEASNARAADPDLRKFHRVLKKSLITATKGDPKQVVPGVGSRVAVEDDSLAAAIETGRSSFSLAVKECQKRRSDSLSKMSDLHRQASMDLNNNLTAYSPRVGVIKNISNANHGSSAFPSPGTPKYRHPSSSVQKGWSSERVPLPQNGNRRQVGAANFSFNNGRTLPSKWEDAERWIFSPVSTDTGLQQSVAPPQRRPKSKSGPLGPSGVAYGSSYSPAVHMFDGMHGGNMLTGSPFSAGIMAVDRLRGGNGPENSEPGITRSVSVHGCAAESLNHFSLPHSPRIDKEYDGVKDAANTISRAVSRRDMATQMSPEGSPCSSSRRRQSTSSALSVVEMRNNHSPRLDARDVEVDERVTMTRWSRKKKSRLGGRGTENVDDWTRKAAEAHSTAWEVSEAAKSISKVGREEARIAAWENLQKAKAEAAIRKLEMKLEKKRLSSMDKIMNKMRLAQKKGQEMRRVVLANQAQQASSSSDRAISLRATRPLSSLSACFICRAF